MCPARETYLGRNEREDLAAAVVQGAAIRRDGAGYDVLSQPRWNDVLSFKPDGSVRHIE